MEGDYPSATAIRQALVQGLLNKEDLAGGQEITQDSFTESLDTLGPYLGLREILDPLDYTSSPSLKAGWTFA